MIEVTMKSGEVIKGPVVKVNELYVYVETTMNYDEQAIALFGKEYCDTHKVLTIALPKDEIVNVVC